METPRFPLGQLTRTSKYCISQEVEASRFYFTKASKLLLRADLLEK
jgi:hypothetical protein